jgi:hypothetical protein
MRNFLDSMVVDEDTDGFWRLYSVWPILMHKQGLGVCFGVCLLENGVVPRDRSYIQTSHILRCQSYYSFLATPSDKEDGMQPPNTNNGYHSHPRI